MRVIIQSKAGVWEQPSGPGTSQARELQDPVGSGPARIFKNHITPGVRALAKRPC